MELLKLKFNVAEEQQFRRKRKELLADANRRKRIEVELHSDRLVLENKYDAAKKSSHKTVDTFDIRLDKGKDQLKKIKSFGGDDMVILSRGRGGNQGVTMKTIDLGLREDIRRAKEFKVSEEVKAELCLEMLTKKVRSGEGGEERSDERLTPLTPQSSLSRRSASLIGAP